MMAQPGHGVLSLIDNREVSPAPVSHFKPKTLLGGSNASVSFPFHRAGSFKAVSTLDKLQFGGLSGAAMAMDDEEAKDETKAVGNFKFSSGFMVNNDSSKLNHISIPQLLQAHGGSGAARDGNMLASATSNDLRIKRTRSTLLNGGYNTKKNLLGLLSQLSNVSNDK